MPAVINYKPELSTLAIILEKATQSEDRYNRLLKKAEDEGNYADFIKRNKGKQFKLQFIRKAWHLMYFKNSYTQQLESTGKHHKNFHITRDEFNDFCRYMFAFDEVPAYKNYLREMLDKKQFFKNDQFKILFENGDSLDSLYSKTKQSYEKWLQGQSTKEQETEKYTLSNYENIFQDKMLYVNVSHFTGFLKTTGIWTENEHGVIQFKALENRRYLIQEYYYADKLEKPEYKNCRKLFNELKTVKLEDALLYEIAMRYLQIDSQIVQNVRTSIIEILNQNIRFLIKNKENKALYELIVPFKKIDSYVGLLAHKKEQEMDPKSKGSSFLTNIAGYLELVKDHKDLKKVYGSFTANKNMPVLTFDDLHKIDAHLITHSIRFTNLALAMEHYFVVKKNISIVKDNRITYDEIKDLKPYFDNKTRNKAFHFGVPSKSYETFIREVEQKFLFNEVKTTKPTSFQSLSRQHKIMCGMFLELIHNDLYNKGEKDSKKKRNDAEASYFNSVISK